MPRIDVVIIGAGAIGASTALHLARAGRRVMVLEKEPGPALHQSGRNSGVVHAGYNVKPGTAKARFCLEGNRQLRAYCAERGIPLEVGGILVVARTEPERAVLAELHQRGTGNGVDVRMLDAEGIRAAEPHAVGIEALQAREAGSFDARAYVHALAGDAVRAGAQILYDTRVLRIEDASLRDPAAGSGDITLRTSKGPVTARVAVNAAGLYADMLAGALAPDMRVIPFRGYYAELAPARRNLVRSHIYPAPDLNFPFLGVHLSRRTDGRVIVGPGAMLAFGREAYRLAQVQPRDLLSTLLWPGFYRMIMQPRFRALVRSELMKSLFLAPVAAEARLLIPELEPGDLVRSYAGNRAQVVSRSGDLVDDIVVRRSS